jgi:hypothetical protein
VRKHITPGLILGGIAVILAMSGSAMAGSLITSKQIKDGTIRSKDIKKGTISANRLSKAARVSLKGETGPAGPAGQTGAQGPAGPQGERGPSVFGSPGAKGDKGDTGAPGAQGAKGDTGAQGPKGDKGDPGPVFSSGNWGVVNRNTIGSPNAFLRSGPFTPPMGKGSLNITVGNSVEKAAYGNEIDFLGGLVDDLTAVGFYVYTTGENNDQQPANMPSIVFEIDPNMADRTTNFSSLVFTPTANSAANQWSPYIDATTTGLWGLTGSQFSGEKCSLNGSRCTFAEVKDLLDDGGEPAKILTVSVTKGRDYAWSGAVDGLRVNEWDFDFEETGVFTRAAQ